MVDTAARGSFDGWYRSEHPRLLALLTVAAGDPDVGREITSEAFVRALERWDRVGEMDAPAAWTYRVGVNLLRRRLRRAAFERRLLPDRPAPAAPPAVESELPAGWFKPRKVESPLAAEPHRGATRGAWQSKSMGDLLRAS